MVERLVKVSNDKFSRKLLVNIIILLELTYFHKTDSLSCILKNGNLGECIKLNQCESAKIALLTSGLSPDYCNIEEESVCCEIESDYSESTKNKSEEEEDDDDYPSDFAGTEVSNPDDKVYSTGYDRKKFYVAEPGKIEFIRGNDHFVPPGLMKKKPWTDERLPGNQFHYEYVTKKPNRGPSHKGPNKFTGNYHEGTDYTKWGEERTTKVPPVFPGDSSDWHGSFSNQRTTTRHNKWMSGTSTTPNPEGIKFGAENRPSGQSNRPHIMGPGHQGSRPIVNQPNVSTGSRMRPSELKCQEFSKEITETITGLPLTTDPDPVIISVRKCVQAQQLIVGGENTTLGEFPHMAAIGFRDRNKQGIAWNCGGTLISDQYVLTAAHCTSTSSGRPIKVRLGEYNLMKNDDGAHPVDYGISEIITHPEYRPPSKYHDIALLKLSRKVRFYKHIRPACLNVENSLPLSKAIATGWGRMFYDGGVSEVLQKVVLSIVDNNTCNRLYKTNVKTEVLSRGIINTQLCAGELSGGKDTCQGDSGGPLSITNTKCIHHIIGITSFGKSCALPNSTGVYTRVSAYVPWIESIVWPSL